VRFNGQPLATTFINSGKLQFTIPSNLLADEGTASITVFDPQNGLSNAQTFHITENTPQIRATVAQSTSLQKVTITGQLIDLAQEEHFVSVDWGDGTIQVFDLGSSKAAPFSLAHSFGLGGPRTRTIKVTGLDDVGTASSTLVFVVRVN